MAGATPRALDSPSSAAPVAAPASRASRTLSELEQELGQLPAGRVSKNKRQRLRNRIKRLRENGAVPAERNGVRDLSGTGGSPAVPHRVGGASPPTHTGLRGPVARERAPAISQPVHGAAGDGGDHGGAVPQNVSRPSQLQGQPPLRPEHAQHTVVSNTAPGPVRSSRITAAASRAQDAVVCAVDHGDSSEAYVPSWDASSLTPSTSAPAPSHPDLLGASQPRSGPHAGDADKPVGLSVPHVAGRVESSASWSNVASCPPPPGTRSVTAPSTSSTQSRKPRKNKQLGVRCKPCFSHAVLQLYFRALACVRACVI